MKKSLIMLLVILGASSSNAFAQQSVDGPKQVNHIYQNTIFPSYTFIKVEGTMINPAGCLDNYWYGIEVSNPFHDNYVSMAMTAMASGKTLTFYISGTACLGGSYPTITGMVINR